MHRDIAIDGFCDPRFVAVRDAFADNFAERDEHGAAVCIAIDTTVVVDLWGGFADDDRTRPWEPDTLVNAFSVGKAMVALLAARLVGEGHLDPDATVVEYWPEFGAAGKDAVTVRHLLTHQAGLPALHDPQPDDLIFDWQAMVATLAAERPWWEPGTAHGYHVNTFGFLVGEVLRRVSGRTPGDLLRRTVAGPLGADVHLGVPLVDQARIAEFRWPPGGLANEVPAELGARLQHNAYFNPTTISGDGVVNTERWRTAELPSTNTHASARGVARVYAALAAGGALDGERVVDEGSLRDATRQEVDGPDVVLGRPSRFGLGFQLTQPDRPLGPNAASFGHFGAGGSLGFCDPTAGVAFGYVMDQIGARWQNSRNRALIDALYASLA